MMHQFRDKTKENRRKMLMRNIGIFVVIVILFIIGFVSFTGRFFHIIGKPLWKTENNVVDATNSSGYLLRTKASVFAENNSLKQQISDLQNRMIDYNILKSENDQLKNLLDRVPANYSFTLGTILTKPNRSPYDTIIIDIGSDVGLSGGERVFANSEIPIGYISTVYSHTALVMLYSSPEEKTEAQITGSNATVELTGRGGGNFEMNISRDLISEKGTTVVLPSIGSLVMAIVEDIISTPTDPIKRVLLTSPVNIQDLKWVQVKRN